MLETIKEIALMCSLLWSPEHVTECKEQILLCLSGDSLVQCDHIGLNCTGENTIETCTANEKNRFLKYRKDEKCYKAFKECYFFVIELQGGRSAECTQKYVKCRRNNQDE